jgi:hypothetical protein
MYREADEFIDEQRPTNDFLKSLYSCDGLQKCFQELSSLMFS